VAAAPRRRRPHRVLTLSLWESAAAIRAFAGDDIEAAVLYPEDERYLIDGESKVTHYAVADQVEGP
jgi:heme-degrading monooxygenase HmoA